LPASDAHEFFLKRTARAGKPLGGQPVLNPGVEAVLGQGVSGFVRGPGAGFEQRTSASLLELEDDSVRHSLEMSVRF
jgi:hypothetical protein